MEKVLAWVAVLAFATVACARVGDRESVCTCTFSTTKGIFWEDHEEEEHIADPVASCETGPHFDASLSYNCTCYLGQTVLCAPGQKNTNHYSPVAIFDLDVGKDTPHPNAPGGCLDPATGETCPINGKGCIRREETDHFHTETHTYREYKTITSVWTQRHKRFMCTTELYDWNQPRTLELYSTYEKDL